ncbi:hypothetical protein CBS101457_005819 [Exobasidium rhododendri]|nr:hypothetical protein CBS101457_005819 [Exobasidium rhododendri]
MKKEAPLPSISNEVDSKANVVTRSRPADSAPQEAQAQQKPTSSWLNQAGSYLSAFSPVKKISDQDYEEQLSERRRQVLDRLREVDEAIVSEAAAQKKV